MYLQKGGTVLIVTHDEDELDICDKVYIVKDGMLRETDRKFRGDKLLEEII